MFVLFCFDSLDISIEDAHEPGTWQGLLRETLAALLFALVLEGLALAGQWDS